MTDRSAESISLNEAINLLENGDVDPDFEVDLGDGRIAKIDGEHGQEGLLQRLVGFRLVLALTDYENGGVNADATAAVDDLMVHPDVSIMLDAIKK